MGSSLEVDARASAVEALARHVARYGETTLATIDAVRRTLREVGVRADEAVREGRDELRRAQNATAAAEAALSRCDRNCDQLVAAAARCRQAEQEADRRLERRRQGAALVHSASSDVLVSLRSASLGVQTNVDTAVAHIRDYAAGLGRYLNTRVGAVGRAPAGRLSASIGSGREGPSAAALPAGFVMVRLDDIDLSDSGMHGSTDFQKVTYDDMAWGVEALARMVLPALERGKSSDYFAERDHTEQLTGDRSYSAVYHAFFSPDYAIKLALGASGRYEVINGYHRLFLAQQLHLQSVPCQVRR